MFQEVAMDNGALNADGILGCFNNTLWNLVLNGYSKKQTITDDRLDAMIQGLDIDSGLQTGSERRPPKSPCAYMAKRKHCPPLSIESRSLSQTSPALSD